MTVTAGAVALGRSAGGSDPDTEAVIVDDGRSVDTVAVGAPDDGTESMGLPVTITPNSGLVDGDTVEVVGEGFPAFAELGIVQCSPHLLPAEGIARCMISTFHRVDADADGRVQSQVAVERILVVGDREVDCAWSPPDGHAASCNLAVGLLSNYDVSGHAPLSFDPDAPLGVRSSLHVEPTVDLGDFQPVTVTLRNPGTGVSWHVNQCVVGAEPHHCGGGAVVDPPDPDQPGSIISADGSDLVATVLVRRMVDTVDCAARPEACSLVVQASGGARLHSLRLSFTPGAPLATAELVVADADELLSGAATTVEVLHRSPGQLVHPILQCPSGVAGVDQCVAVGQPHLLVASGSVATVTPRHQLEAGGTLTDCSVAGACVLRLVDRGGAVAAELPIRVGAG